MEWYWWLLILFIVMGIVWWALLRNAKATEVPTHKDEHEKLSDVPAAKS